MTHPSPSSRLRRCAGAGLVLAVAAMTAAAGGPPPGLAAHNIRAGEPVLFSCEHGNGFRATFSHSWERVSIETGEIVHDLAHVQDGVYRDGPRRLTLSGMTGELELSPGVVYQNCVPLQ
jgi:hypothetical protein